MNIPFMFKAPISAITIGRTPGDEQYTLIASTRWSIPDGFCVPLGEQYAVFTPTEGVIESPLLPKLRGYPVEDWYTFKLSRIEPQATGPVLRLSDVLVSPVESPMHSTRAHCEPLGSFLHRAMREVSEHATGPKTPLKIGCAWDGNIKTSVLTLDDGDSVTLTVNIDEDLRICQSDESVAQVTLKLHNSYN